MEKLMPVDSLQKQEAEDAEGRFTKGHSGNPCGRLPGPRNKATVVAELLEKAAPIRERPQLFHESRC